MLAYMYLLAKITDIFGSPMCHTCGILSNSISPPPPGSPTRVDEHTEESIEFHSGTGCYLSGTIYLKCVLFHSYAIHAVNLLQIEEKKMNIPQDHHRS
jgi:hypothetical protein